MRVLILSCNTGQGHNSAAAAVKEVFDRHGVSCEVTDALRFISDGVSNFMSWGHSCMYRRFPGLFRAGYAYSEKHTGTFQENSPVYRFLTSGARKLYQFCIEGQYDTIISAHVFASLMLTRALKQYHLKVKTYFISTDYTCSPSMAQSDLDYYFIPSAELTDEFVSCGLVKEKLIPTGIPVRQMFFADEEREAVKQFLGVASEHSHLLMMCGSMGCGPMESMAKYLVDGLSEKQEISIVCGTNRKLEKKLSRQFQGKRNVHVLGYVEDMPQLMDSADLYLTKPGGISVTEAAVKGLPMVLVDAVAGCEKYNMQYYIKRNGAVTADSPKSLARLCVDLLGDEFRLENMKREMKEKTCGNGAQNIFHFVAQQSGDDYE